MDTLVDNLIGIIPFIIILLITIFMCKGVIYLCLKPGIPIEYRLFIVLFIIFVLFRLTTFFSLLLFPIAILHTISFLAWKSRPIARLWTPSLTRWFCLCTIFIFVYLYLSTPDFMWTIFRDLIKNAAFTGICHVRGITKMLPNLKLDFLSILTASFYAPYIALAFVTIACLFKKLFKKLSRQKEPA